ncbi:MAG: PIN domain-containing protein [Oscillospiraceae bacterium]|nr:PIN domain-containing protein [Oscillospiraceae bacterium]
MKIAFDTNVLIDAIAERREYRDAQALILAVAQERIDGVISANSITDIYYILRKRIGDGKAREAIWNLMAVFEVAEVNAEICSTALGTAMKDFEDAVLAVCAKQAGAEKVVTGDEGFLQETESPIAVATVRAVLETLV